MQCSCSATVVLSLSENKKALQEENNMYYCLCHPTCSAPRRTIPSCQSGPSALPASVGPEPWPRAFLSGKSQTYMNTPDPVHVFWGKQTCSPVAQEKTCCEGLGCSRWWFLSGVASPLTGNSSIRFVSLQGWDEELRCTSIKERVAYGFVFYSPDHLTALHLIPKQIMFTSEQPEWIISQHVEWITILSLTPIPGRCLHCQRWRFSLLWIIASEIPEIQKYEMQTKKVMVVCRNCLMLK